MFLMLVVVSIVAVHLMLITLAYVDFEYIFFLFMNVYVLVEVWCVIAGSYCFCCCLFVFFIIVFFSVVVVYVSLLLYALLKYKQKKLMYTAKFTLGIYTGAKQQYAAKQFPSSNFTVTCHISHVNMLALRWQTGTEGTKNCEYM